MSNILQDVQEGKPIVFKYGYPGDYKYSLTFGKMNTSINGISISVLVKEWSPIPYWFFAVDGFKPLSNSMVTNPPKILQTKHFTNEFIKELKRKAVTDLIS